MESVHILHFALDHFMMTMLASHEDNQALWWKFLVIVWMFPRRWPFFLFRRWFPLTVGFPPFVVGWLFSQGGGCSTRLSWDWDIPAWLSLCCFLSHELWMRNSRWLSTCCFSILWSHGIFFWFCLVEGCFEGLIYICVVVPFVVNFIHGGEDIGVGGVEGEDGDATLGLCFLRLCSGLVGFLNPMQNFP